MAKHYVFHFLNFQMRPFLTSASREIIEIHFKKIYTFFSATEIEKLLCIIENKTKY